MLLRGRVLCLEEDAAEALTDERESSDACESLLRDNRTCFCWEGIWDCDRDVGTVGDEGGFAIFIFAGCG